MTVTGVVAVGTPPALSVTVGSVISGNSAKPCCVEPPILVKSPPASRVPSPPASAYTPRTPFAAGCHAPRLPVVSSSASRWSRAPARGSRRAHARSAVVVEVPADIDVAAVDRDRLVVAVQAADPQLRAGRGVERDSSRRLRYPPRRRRCVDGERGDRVGGVRRPAEQGAGRGADRADLVPGDAVKACERASDDQARAVGGQGNRVDFRAALGSTRSRARRSRGRPRPDSCVRRCRRW